MAFMAAANLLGAMGHLANLGQVAEVAQSRTHQLEQMEWARRAYRLDSRTLRIDILNAVKEDVRDHHDTYAGRIDTLLLVHTLLLTFALATLQFSDQYVPQTAESCPECVEVAYPVLVEVWVYLIAAILILPFWCILMLLWCKLRLDGWLEKSVRRLNNELRSTLSSQSFYTQDSNTPGEAAGLELECVERAIARLAGFVVDHQDRFVQVWGGECDSMVRATTNLLWVNAVVAVSITAGMFWMFLRNHLEEHHRVATNFMILVLAGLLAPLLYWVWRRIQPAWARRGKRTSAGPVGGRGAGALPETYVSCSESDSDGWDPDDRGGQSASSPLLGGFPGRGDLPAHSKSAPNLTSGPGLLTPGALLRRLGGQSLSNSPADAPAANGPALGAAAARRGLEVALAPPQRRQRRQDHDRVQPRRSKSADIVGLRRARVDPGGAV